MIICLATGISAMFSFRILVTIIGAFAMYTPQTRYVSPLAKLTDFPAPRPS